jgi:hypothetical protein
MAQSAPPSSAPGTRPAFLASADGPLGRQDQGLRLGSGPEGRATGPARPVPQPLPPALRCRSTRFRITFREVLHFQTVPITLPSPVAAQEAASLPLPGSWLMFPGRQDPLSVSILILPSLFRSSTAFPPSPPSSRATLLGNAILAHHRGPPLDKGQAARYHATRIPRGKEVVGERYQGSRSFGIRKASKYQIWIQL